MPTKSTKRGGALADDIGKLLVPMGILLAEKSLGKMIKNDRKTAATTRKTETARRVTVVGGGKKKTTKTKKGGKNLMGEIDKLSSDIQHFLSNY